jgi:hypothetical protein
MDTIVVKANKVQSKIVREFLDKQNVSYETNPLKLKAKAREEKPYNSEFVQMVLSSSQQAKEGKITKIAIEDLWK